MSLLRDEAFPPVAIHDEFRETFLLIPLEQQSLVENKTEAPRLPRPPLGVSHGTSTSPLCVSCMQRTQKMRVSQSRVINPDSAWGRSVYT